ncbi:hypothetical protein GGI12_000158 [Dipsacomyces acuminosporus]|nr:hypothetical protein GGI12_000158 [Dipsacomyces acuminosporus]
MDQLYAEHDVKRKLHDPELAGHSSGDDTHKKQKTRGDLGRSEEEKDLQISFKSAEEIAKALDTTNADLLVQGASANAQARLLHEASRRVVYEWAELAGDFAVLSEAWQFALNNNVPRLDGIVPSAIGALLATLDTQTTNKYGTKLVRVVLDGFMKAIYKAFGTPRSFACSATLQLLHQIVVFGKGAHADEVRQTFDWTLKSLEMLPTIRSSGSGVSIRTHWIRFVFSFFSVEHCRSYNELLKTGSIVSSLFRGAERDTYAELHEFLTLVYTNIIVNPRAERSGKVKVFSPSVVELLVKATGKKEPMDPVSVGVPCPALFIPVARPESQQTLTTDSISALVFRFLYGLMTYPGYGICFKEYGLYTTPRRWHSESGDKAAAYQVGDDDSHDVAVISKTSSSTRQLQYICNSAIMRILAQCISPSSSKEMADLVVRILRVSPELIAPFWRNVSCSFEPRLSLMYLANTTLALKVLGLPLPIPGEHDIHHSGPPSLNTLVEHIIPVTLTRSLLGRGLQHRASTLVRYRTLLIVDLALRKLDAARAWIQSESRRADSSGAANSSRWLLLEQRLLAAAKQRMPEWQLVVFAHQELAALAESTKPGSSDAAVSGRDLRESECQHAVLNNVVMRVINGYQKHFNELVVESRFDIGKLISDICLPDAISTGGVHAERIRNPMNTHALLYSLRALSTTPASHIKWSTRAKAGSGTSLTDPMPHTYLGIVLMLYLFSVQPELRKAARSVCANAFLSTGLFDHEVAGSNSGTSAASEANCWLDALASLASPHANSNVRLSNIPESQLAKGRALVAFLEDVAGLAAKLPYKYVDWIQAHMADDGDGVCSEMRDRLPFSPLLAAIIEAGILKSAVGNGTLAVSLRSAAQSKIEAEMHTNSMFVYAREVACRIAESKGWSIARHLQTFLSAVAGAVLQPRIAKIESDSNAASERRHYKNIEAAFVEASRGVLAYLSVVKSPEALSSAHVAADPTGFDRQTLPRKVSKRLESELAVACADIESSADAFINRLVDTLREHSDTTSAHAITAWILEQAAKGGVDDKGGVLRIATTWISLAERTAVANAALWSQPAFAELAPQVLRSADESLLITLFRHLLVSRQVGSLLMDSTVQLLLAQISFASKGSAKPSFYVIQLVLQLVATHPAVHAHTKAPSLEHSTSGDACIKPLAFLFALATAHLASLTRSAQHTTIRQKQYQAQLPVDLVLEKYAVSFGPLVKLPTASSFKMALDFYIAKLARKSARAPSSTRLDVSKAWLLLSKHIEPAVVDAFGLKMQEQRSMAVYSLALLRIVSPVLGSDRRTGLVKALYAFISDGKVDVALLPSVITTALSLASDIDDAASSVDVSIQPIKDALSSHIVSLWIRSLAGRTQAGGRAPGAALEHAADSATRRLAVLDFASLASNKLPGKLCQRIGVSKASLTHFDRMYSAKAAIDIQPALEYLWHASGDTAAYARCQGTRSILARLLGADSGLRQAAYEWISAMVEGCELGRTRLELALWLVGTLSASYSYAEGSGLVVWEDSPLSSSVRNLCLRLGDAVFSKPGDSLDISKYMPNADMVFIAKVYIQTSDQTKAVAHICKMFASSTTRSLAEACAQILCSKALRTLKSANSLDANLGTLASVIELGHSLVSRYEEAELSEEPAWDALAVVVNTLEHYTRYQDDKAKASDHGSALLLQGFRTVDSIVRATCRPFSENADMSSSEAQRLVTRYPVHLYRFIAFTVQIMQSIASMGGVQADSGLKWFMTLQRLLGCRLFSDRIWSADMRSPLVLAISGLWSLAMPSLSRWSASLDDYLTLDELESLIGAYGGTFSCADQALLRVVCGYESTTRQSIQRVALLFGPSAARNYANERLGRCQYLIERNENDIGVLGEDTISQAILTIDSGRLFRTVLNFPVNYLSAADKLDPTSKLLAAISSGGSRDYEAPGDGRDLYDSEQQIYNPQFILAWLWTIVSSKVPFDIRKLFESNAAGVALTALSSADIRLRKLAYYILDALYSLLANAPRLTGQRQYVLLFDSLRNAITDRSDSEFPRLPFTVTLFVATSINVLMHPDHHMFGEVNRLLLSRPYLKLGSIPLLHSVLRSTHSPHRERVYVLRMAAHGARAFDLSASTFKRSSFVSIMLTLASNPLGDVLISKAAFDMLFHITSADNTRAMTQYVSKHRFSLLAWIREQVSLQINSMLESASQLQAVSAAAEGASGSVFSSLHRMQASVMNLNAFMRLVGRIVVNFPLAHSNNDNLEYSRFWVVQSSNQSNAPGQTAVVSLIERILDGLLRSLEIVSNSSDAAKPMQAKITQSSLALVRSLLETAQILVRMQRSTGPEQPLALQSPNIAKFAVASLRALEPSIGCAFGDLAPGDQSKITGTKLCSSSCSIAAIARAQFSESLFRINASAECSERHAELDSICENYRACLESLFFWCFGSPWDNCSQEEFAEVVSRMLAANTASALKVVSWIRESPSK